MFYGFYGEKNQNTNTLNEEIKTSKDLLSRIGITYDPNTKVFDASNFKKEKLENTINYLIKNLNEKNKLHLYHLIYFLSDFINTSVSGVKLSQPWFTEESMTIDKTSLNVQIIDVVTPHLEKLDKIFGIKSFPFPSNSNSNWGFNENGDFIGPPVLPVLVSNSTNTNQTVPPEDTEEVKVDKVKSNLTKRSLEIDPFNNKKITFDSAKSFQVYLLSILNDAKQIQYFFIEFNRDNIKVEIKAGKNIMEIIKDVVNDYIDKNKNNFDIDKQANLFLFLFYLSLKKEFKDSITNFININFINTGSNDYNALIKDFFSKKLSEKSIKLLKKICDTLKNSGVYIEVQTKENKL